MAVHVLASARAGLESTRGTGVTPTRIVYFDQGTVHTQDVGTIIPQQAWASYEPNRRAYAGMERDMLQFSGNWTYTMAYFWLNLAVDAEASGSVTDTSAYTWTFLPVHTSDALKSATFQYAYADLLSTVGWSLPGCIANELSVTWTKSIGGENTGVTFSANLMSASVASQITAFTGSLSDFTERHALGNQTKTYINATGSAFGATADTRVNQATWTVNNGFVYRDGFDGTSNAVEIVRTGKRMSRLTVQRYFNDTTELNAYIAKTSRRIRILNEGSVVGATTTKESTQLDYGGVTEVHSHTDVDGLVYANIEYAPLDDTSISSDFKWTTVNTAATIT